MTLLTTATEVKLHFEDCNSSLKKLRQILSVTAITTLQLFIVYQQESTEEEKEAATKFLKVVVGEEKELLEVAQGEEPDEFWDALGRFILFSYTS